MNRTNVQKVIDHLEHLKKVGNVAPFDMANWFKKTDGLSNSYDEDDVPTNPTEAAHLLAVMEGASSVAPEERFKCNTVACIAGHTALIAEAEGFDRADDYSISEAAEVWLELNDAEAHDLFMPSLAQLGLHEITIDNAIYALKHLVDVGYVSWPVSFYPRDPKNPRFGERFNP